MKTEVIQFKSLLGCHSGRDFLIFCPGKGISEWSKAVNAFVSEQNIITIGCNKIMDLITPVYHIFTNHDKYQAYGGSLHKTSRLILGSHMSSDLIKKHKPHEYISVNYTDRDPKEPIRYDKGKGVIHGYYRTSGNLAIMLSHLMGARNIYLAGMSGFTYHFDGMIHYYKAEIKRDSKSRKEWYEKYDKPAISSLGNLKKFGIKFKIITPTLYEQHFDGDVLKSYK